MMAEKHFGRIGSIDALRGLAVLLMVVHHFLYDLVVFCDLPWWLFENPLFNVLHYIFAGLFIVLSGISAVFSRSNIKRGIRAYLLAMGITLVTALMGLPVRFGVLHMLGASMLFYGLTWRIWEGMPRKLRWLLYAGAILLTGPLVRGRRVLVTWLWAFGFFPEGFFSSDYFPLLPWLFVFLLGTLIGRYVREGCFPDFFYRLRVPLLEGVGRRALLIYILHQPLLYGLTMLLRPVLA